MPQSSFARETAEAPDTPFDISLRPPIFSEFSGQAKVRERLELMVEAAKQRGDVLEHILLSGPPGLGKTTLAYIVANAMGVNIKSTSGPMIEKPGDLAGLLTTLERGDVLFIDEIHRLQPAIEEYLYPAMEDYKLDIIIDQGPNARSVRLNLPKFTLIGATTRAGMISAPLRSRFGMNSRLDYYTAEELQKIVRAQRRAARHGYRRRRRAARSPRAPAARPASPTTCCAGCAITRRSRPRRHHHARSRRPRARHARHRLATVLTKWTSASSRR